MNSTKISFLYNKKTLFQMFISNKAYPNISHKTHTTRTQSIKIKTIQILSMTISIISLKNMLKNKLTNLK